MVAVGTGGAVVKWPDTVPASVIAGRGGVVRFTISEVQAMIRGGFLAEDSSTELLDGIIVHKDRSEQGGDPMSHGLRHRKCVRRLAALSGRIDTADRHVQSQLPIVCDEGQMPEPDFAVIRGTDDDYDDAMPSAADAHCVFEVADSSLERDRREKLPVYARAGVADYFIVNLRHDVIEHYSEPDRSSGTYRTALTMQIMESVHIPLGGGHTLELSVKELIS